MRHLSFKIFKIIKFFKQHIWYAVTAIFLAVLEILAIIFEFPKWLAIIGVVLVLGVSFVNKHKSDTIDCGEY